MQTRTEEKKRDEWNGTLTQSNARAAQIALQVAVIPGRLVKLCFVDHLAAQKSFFDQPMQTPDEKQVVKSLIDIVVYAFRAGRPKFINYFQQL
jgi:hypothetical protein